MPRSSQPGHVASSLRSGDRSPGEARSSLESSGLLTVLTHEPVDGSARPAAIVACGREVAGALDGKPLLLVHGDRDEWLSSVLFPS